MCLIKKNWNTNLLTRQKSAIRGDRWGGGDAGMGLDGELPGLGFRLGVQGDRRGVQQRRCPWGRGGCGPLPAGMCVHSYFGGGKGRVQKQLNRRGQQNCRDLWRRIPSNQGWGMGHSNIPVSGSGAPPGPRSATGSRGTSRLRTPGTPAGSRGRAPEPTRRSPGTGD